MIRLDSGSPRRTPIATTLVAIAATVAIGGWWAHQSMLSGIGRLLVEEDPVGSPEIVVVSNSIARSSALEAGLLYRQHVVSHIVMAAWMDDPLVGRLREMGIPCLDVTEMSMAILAHSGVPESAITVLPERVDGTSSEVSAIAAFVGRQRPASVLVITARSHTARTKWLLQRSVPKGVRVFVRSSRFDGFSADEWWRERGQAREVVVECLRWLNTLILPNLWSRDSASSATAATRERTAVRPAESSS